MAVETLTGSIDAANSAGAVLASSGSSNAKGAYTEWIASSGIAADAIIAHLQGVTNQGDYLIDIATGAAASEVDKIANFPFARQVGSPTLVYPAIFPFRFALGSRIAARQQTTNTTGAMRAAAYLLKKDTVSFHDCTSCVTYGANTGDSGGTSIDPGASINTKGSYVQITASTTANIKWLLVMLGNQNNAARTTANLLIDIAVGAAAAEVVVLSDLWAHLPGETDLIVPPMIGPFPIEIASGSRIAARAQCQINDGTDRLFDLSLIGFDGAASSSGGAHFSGFMS